MVVMLLMAFALFVGSCKKDEGTTPPSGDITVSGSVVTFANQAIANASVKFFAGSTTTGSTVATATSNQSGQWQLTLPSSGRYTCVVSAAGYPTAIVTVIVPSGQQNVNLGATILAAGRLNGVINDAQDAQPIAGATVRFFAGTAGDTAGVRVDEATTDNQGRWTLTLTLGNYVCVVYATGRLTLVQDVPVTDTAAVQMVSSVSQPVPTGQMRIVLNWNHQPYDLDAHLTGPDEAGGRFHVYFSDRIASNPAGDTLAFLDIDVIPSYGPETITIKRFTAGEYRYKVHYYRWTVRPTPSAMSDSSDAVVRVFTSGGQVKQYSIPRGRTGNVWYVFRIDGASRQITDVNTFADSVSAGDAGAFRTAPGAKWFEKK